jgi:hypothetical protein
VMAGAVAITRLPDMDGRGPSAAPTPAGALGMAELALVDLVESLYGIEPAEAFSAQDMAILDAVHEAVSAAHRRFQALRADRTADVALWTARLQVAARHLGKAALGL